MFGNKGLFAKGLGGCGEKINLQHVPKSSAQHHGDWVSRICQTLSYGTTVLTRKLNGHQRYNKTISAYSF